MQLEAHPEKTLKGYLSKLDKVMELVISYWQDELQTAVL